MVELVAIVIIAGVAAFIFYPLRTPAWLIPLHGPVGLSNERKELREKKAGFLLTLRELDFDYEMGKISTDDYKSLRSKFQASAVEVMKRLDELEAKWQKVQEQVDKEITTEAPSTTAPSQTTPVQKKEGAGAKFCSSCGKPVVPSDRFCGSCGAQLHSVKAYA